jgi:hypothetical protein
MAVLSLTAQTASKHKAITHILYVNRMCVLFEHKSFIQQHTTQQQLHTAVDNPVTASPCGDVTSTQCRAGAHIAYFTGILRTLLAYCVLLGEKNSIISDCHP